MGDASAGDRFFLERDIEIKAAADTLDRARHGDGSLTVISGPPGIGKTALLDRVCEMVTGEERVMRASADELEALLPFGVAEQLLGEPVVDPRGAAPSAGEATLRAVHLSFRRIEELAAAHPVLIAVDDVHWADAASLRLLVYLSRRLSELAVTVFAAVRTTEEPDPETRQLIERLEQLASLTLRPEPLSAAGVTRLVSAALGDAGADLGATVVHETAGNPLLVHWLIDRVSVRAQNEGMPANASELEGIAAIDAGELGARPARLGPETEALARAIALLHVDATLDRAARATGIDRDDAASQIGRLQRAGILSGGDRIEFVHPIVKSAVLGSMTPGDRTALAHRVARAMHETGVRSDRVANLLLAAGGSREPWALDVLTDAAAAASGGGVPARAADCLRLAIEMPQPPADRAGRLLALAQAEAFSGTPGYEERFEQALAAIEDPTVKAGALAGLADTRTTARYEIAEAIALLLRAIEVAADDRDLEARLVAMGATIVAMTESPPPELIARIQSETERLLADPPVEAGSGERMLFSQGVMAAVLRMGTDREGALRLTAQLDRLGGPPVEPAVLTPYVLALIACDELAGAERLVEEGMAEASRQGAVTQHMWLLGARALARWHRGEPATALEDIRDSLATADELGVQAPVNVAVGANAALDAEGTESAAQILAQAETGRLAGTLAIGELQFAMGRLAAARGKHEEALDLHLQAGQALAPRGFVNPGHQSWRSAAALSAHATGDRRADDLAGEELELARRFGAPRPLGIGLRAQGLITGGARGLELIEESVAVLEASPARLERARSLLALGGALRRAHRPDDAKARLAAAVDLAHACRAQPIVEQGLAELRTLGLRRPRPALTGLEALTPAELRTGQMAASGMSNKEIASSLFLALRTIESHLTSTYKKLEIGSRDELAGALRGRNHVSNGS